MAQIEELGTRVLTEKKPRWDAGSRLEDPAKALPNLAAEHEVWLIRIRADPKAVMWVPDALWKDEEFHREAVAANVRVLEHIDSRAEVSRSQRVLITRYALDHGHGVPTDDRKVMLEAIKLHGSAAFR